MSFISLLLLHLLVCSFQATERSINWWVTIGSNDTITEANVQTISAHKNLFSQLQIQWPAGCTLNGDISAWWLKQNNVEKWLALFKPLDIPIVPVAICIKNATIMYNKIYNNATDFALTLVDIAKTYGFYGFSFDYEPVHGDDNNNNSAIMYQSFLKTVSNIFHANGLILTIYVANWSKALSNFGLLAQSGVDELQDMETYGGYQFDYELDYMFQFMNSIENATNNNYSQSVVGLGCYQTDYWNQTLLNWVIGNMTANGGYKLMIFRLKQQDGVIELPPMYWWTSLEMFMNGTL